jgi:hypothetical protein
VEFDIETDPRGRLSASKVTGPLGSYVQGAPKQFSRDSYGGGHDDYNM